jgi:hypothetical protein
MAAIWPSTERVKYNMLVINSLRIDGDFCHQGWDAIQKLQQQIKIVETN